MSNSVCRCCGGMMWGRPVRDLMTLSLKDEEVQEL